MSNRRRLITSLLIFISVTVCSIRPSSGAEPILSLTFAVDASGSMRGQNIEKVRQSISDVMENLDTPAQLSLISFADEAKVLVSNSSQNIDVIKSLKVIQPGGRTALYDGVQAALGVTKDSKNSVIVVFSDGDDNSSISSSSEAKIRADNFAGLVVLVGLGSSVELAGRLSEIAGNRGQVISISSTLTLIDRLNSIIQPPSAMTLRVTQSVGVENNDSFILPYVLFLLSICLLLLAVGKMARQRVSQRERMRFLSVYDTQKEKFKDESIFFRLLRVPIFSRYAVGEEKRLMVAGLKLSIQNWVYLQFALFLALGLILVTTGVSGLFALALSGAGSFGLCSGYLRLKRNQKILAFSNELPDILTIIASSLKSGLSFSQAMTSVAHESQGEVSLQFRRVLAEVQMGRNLNDALLDVAERMDSQDFRWTISALGIQREVGGNLSEILATTSETIRGRAEIRNEIKALSAEGRMSAYVLVALPIIMLLYLRLTRPDSFTLLFSTTGGLVMMTVVLVLMTIGWFWVQKVVKIKLT